MYDISTIKATSRTIYYSPHAIEINYNSIFSDFTQEMWQLPKKRQIKNENSILTFYLIYLYEHRKSSAISW
jgi:hypothetical protein